MPLFLKLKTPQFLVVLLFLGYSGMIQGQTRQYKNRAYHFSIDPQYENWNNFYNDTLIYSNQANIDTTYTLALVFHILYNNTSPISLQEIEGQVTALNEHFSNQEFERKSAMIPYKGYHSRAIDTKISFCANHLSENGQTAIQFIATDSLSFVDFNNMKFDSTGGSNAWNPSKYINIWVCNLSSGTGYAQLPGNSSNTDGIVIDFDFFGVDAVQNYQGGKSLTHLMGGFLGLHELWGIWDCQDDGVMDTPIHNATNWDLLDTSSIHISACDFQPEMYMNFMDNTVDSLLCMFTKGQKQRMQSILSPYGKRATLLKLPDCSPALDVADDVVPKRARNPTLIEDGVEVNIHPNPVADRLVMEVNSNFSTKLEVQFFDLTGRLITSAKKEIVKGVQEFQWQVGNWTAGMYHIRYQTDEKKIGTTVFIKK